MNCEVCQQPKYFYQVNYKPTENFKVRSSLSNLQNKNQEQRSFCSSKCLKEWCEFPDNWK